jgi:glycosyltransferase involved in cell wall biosynthesis
MTLLLDEPPIPRTWNAPEADTVLNDRGEPLRVLNVNNHHLGPGGYEVFFRGVTTILRGHGHHVSTHERDNADVVTAKQKLAAFGTAIYSKRAADNMRRMIEADSIDLVHLNNIWPLVSPSAIDGCREAYGGRGVPVVMKLADYKMTCPAGQHIRDGKVCTKCLGGREYWATIHGCKENRIWSTAFAIRNVAARMRGVFRDRVTLFQPCSNFVRDHYIAAGFRPETMHVLPDFTDVVEQETYDPESKGSAGYAAFVGRISPEKGLATLMEAAPRTGIVLKIAGDPSPMPGIEKTAPEHVEFVGKLSRDELPAFFSNARFLVVPSEWYEASGIVASEAQGVGTPVVATRMGGLPEVVLDEVTGLICNPADPADLAAKMRRLWTDDDLAVRLGETARLRARREFDPEVFYRRLAASYQRALDRHREAA